MSLLLFFSGTEVTPPGSAIMPDITGLDVEVGSNQLETLGIQYKVNYQYSTGPARIILSQSVPAGDLVSGLVTIVVSAEAATSSYWQARRQRVVKIT